MAQRSRPVNGMSGKPAPYWSQALRALREARGITQDGWSTHLGYGRATIRRWEAGQTVPSAAAETAIIDLCTEKRLFRTFTDGPLAGITVTPEWIADLLAAARLNDDLPEPCRPDPRPATPRVRYALSGNVSIAYQVFGDGPLDIVVTPGAVSHRDTDWEHPGAVAFFTALAAIGRVIVFDKRGTGMSDHVSAGTIEERMDDIRAVMDAAGSDRAALVGISEGGPMSILFAATWPDRITALVLYGAYARMAPAGHGSDETRLERLVQTWGTPDSPFLQRFGPSAAADPDARAWWARYQRMGASPGAVRDLNRMNAGIDVRAVLPAIRVPTLVLHRTGDRAVDIAEGHHLARTIPGAQLVELPGNDHLPWLGQVKDITSAITRFVTDAHEVPGTDRVLATVLCAVVDESLREAFGDIARAELPRWRGREVPARPDCLLATIDGPTRAVQCARALLNAASAHGVQARIGIHTGEVEVSHHRIAGATVDLSRALAEVAAPGDVLVSGTVTDLMSDPGITLSADVSAILDNAPPGLRVSRVAPLGT